jgi:Zn-dependent protease with chaperone function
MSRRQQHRPRGREVEVSAVTALAPLLAITPLWLIALLPVWLLARVWWDVSFPVIAVGHLAAGVLLFFRPVQAAVLGRLVGARPPTPDQWAILDGAWRSVLQVNRIPRSRYVLMVLPSNEINAYACGGHLVVVTSYAVETLPRDELSGVLAHELSHHLGLHTVALTITQWMSTPVWLLARVGFTLQNVATAATSAFVSHSSALTALGRLVSALFTAVSWVLLTGLWVSNAIANVVGRRSELEADSRAIEMGFGRPLLSALRRTTTSSVERRSMRWIDRLAITHPPARVRTARIEASLRQAAQRERRRA